MDQEIRLLERALAAAKSAKEAADKDYQDAKDALDRARAKTVVPSKTSVNNVKEFLRSLQPILYPDESLTDMVEAVLRNNEPN